jgi:hypothetical protein
MANLLGAPAPPPVIAKRNGQPRAIQPKPAPPAEPAVLQIETFRAGKRTVEPVGTGGEAVKKPADAGGSGGDKEDK